MDSFSEQLAFGRIAEGQIANWLRQRCQWCVMPAYEKQIDSGKGPQFFTPSGSLVAPDFIAVRHDTDKATTEIRWIEAKHKTVFSWHRITGQWTTGIDVRHYVDYQRVAVESNLPVWLLFLHVSSVPDERDLAHGCPPECPVGLFGGELMHLIENENHRSDKWGRSGMVYWAHGTLKRIATHEEVSGVAVCH